jgi:hypothetical protein
MDRLCPRTEDGKVAPAALTLGAVLRACLTSVLNRLPLGARVRRVLRLLAACGTSALGAHIYQCDACHQRHCAPRSCGDRHCPRCLAGRSRQWLQQQQASLLPIPYYHCVFTLPSELHTLVLLNPARLYPLLFACASQALLEFGRQRLGGDLGITAVLHTWGQQLNFHPHLHCIVTGGALRTDGQRWTAPPQRKFLFPVRAVAALFRGKFLDGVKKLLAEPEALRLPDDGWKDPIQRARRLSALYAQRWVVYAKRPWGGPEQVLSYLANYTHRVAISNRRLVALDLAKQTVTFTCRDYRHGSVVKELTLSAREFIRRFSWHILPVGLVRIRHYGILANNRRHRDVPRARALLEKRARRRPRPVPAVPVPAPAPAPRQCPHCGSEKVRWIGCIDARGCTHLSVAALWDSS